MNEIINFGDGKTVKVILQKGEAGNDIESVTKTGTSGLVDIYTITLTDGTTHNFTVTNGSNIHSIDKTSTTGLVDTYTVTLTNGSTTTFTVTNGRSITNIELTSTSGLVDTYTITYNDNTTSTFTVTNGGGNVDNAYKVMGYNGAKNLLDLNNVGKVTQRASISINADNGDIVSTATSASSEYVAQTYIEIPYSMLKEYAGKRVIASFSSYTSTKTSAKIIIYYNLSTFLANFGEYSIITNSVEFNIPNNLISTDKIQIVYRIAQGESVSVGDNLTVNGMMLRLAEDTDTTYQPYAMTNKELTPIAQSVGVNKEYEDSSKTLAQVIGLWADKVKKDYEQCNTIGYVRCDDGYYYINVIGKILTNGYITSGLAVKVGSSGVASTTYAFYRQTGSNAVLTELAPKSDLDSYIKTVEITVTPNTTQSVKSCLDSAIRYFYDNYYEYGKVFYVIIRTLPVAENWYPILYMQIHCSRNELQRATINGAGYALDGYCYGIKATIYNGNYLIAIWKNGQEMEE